MRRQRVSHAAVLALACFILPGTLGHRLLRTSRLRACGAFPCLPWPVRGGRGGVKAR